MLRKVDYAIAGTQSAADVWRSKGYTGAMRVIPQFGVDMTLFKPAEKRPNRPFTIGYAGRLVEEKGIHLLIDAAAQLQGNWRLRILGGGPLLEFLRTRAGQHHIAHRVQFDSYIPSTEMPEYYPQLDVLVLPSLTRPNWKEQFGRVLVEAMASGVVVVGSDSGAIPEVIGDAGVVVPENNVRALADALQRLRDDHALRAHLALMGLDRVEAHFTNAQVAAETVDVYREMMSR